MKKINQNILLFLFSMILLTLFSVQIFASESKKIIKVGFPELRNFSQTNEDGIRSGYTYEYLRTISSYTNWQYEFISGQIGELHDKLVDGSIDLIGGVIKNEQTQETFDFPEYHCGSTFATLSILSDNMTYSSGDYNSFNGMRVGVIKTAKQRINNLQKFCDINGIEVIIIPIDSDEKIQQDLKDGKIDAVLGGDLALIEDSKVIAKFAETPYYFATTKGKSDIIKDLNFAIGTIEQHNMYYSKTLYQKYFKQPDFSNIIFSQSEKNYIENTDTLKISVVSDWYPMIYLDKKSNSYKGLSVDILSKISSFSGLKFEFVPADNVAQSMKQVYNGESVMTACMIQNFDLAEQYDIMITLPYLTTQNMLISKKSTNTSNLSQLTAARMLGSTLINTNDAKKVIDYKNMKECFDAVVNEKVDYTLCNSYTTEILMHIIGNQEMLITSVPLQQISMGFGISKNADKNLITILEKIIYAIPEEEYRLNLTNHIIEINNKIKFSDLIYMYPMESLIIVILIAIIIVVILFLFMYTRVKHSQEIAEYGNSYRILADTAGEICFMYDINKDIMTLLGEKSNKFFEKNIIVDFSKWISQKDSPVSFSEKDFKKLFINKSNGENSSAEIQCRLKSGDWKWFQTVYTIIYSEILHNKPIRIIGRLIDIDDEYNEKEHLLYLSQKDSLTNLLNRKTAEKEITDLLKQNHDITSGILLIIDIDHFKVYNDKYGHQSGDKILHFLADSMCTTFSSKDILCRWGGDEFLIFINKDTNIEQLQTKIDILCNIMRDYKNDDILCPITLSIGGAVAKENTTLSILFKKADDALYEVKNTTRDGFILY